MVLGCKAGGSSVAGLLELECDVRYDLSEVVRIFRVRFAILGNDSD